MSLGGFGSQRHVTERADVVDVDGARPAGERAVVETVHVQLGVAHLDGTDHADDTGLGQGRGQDSHHITALVGGGGVGGDVGLSEGVGGGAPREGGVGEVPGDLLEGSTVLGTVGDHQVIAFFGVPADRRGCVLDYEGSVGDGHLRARVLRHDHVHRVHDALGEGQVIGGARSHHRDPQRLHRHFLVGHLFVGHFLVGHFLVGRLRGSRCLRCGGRGGGGLLRVVSAGRGYQGQDRQDGQKPGETRFP